MLNVNIERKQLGTAETLAVILEHRKILSECIKLMDEQGTNYIAEHQLFGHIKRYTELCKPDIKRRIEIAFATENLLQSHIVMDADKGQGESRLYFQSAVLGVVRLCDVSLFKKLTDVQLKTHLSFLNQSHRDLRAGLFDFTAQSDDFVEFIDNLLMNMGELLSKIRQNVSKMQGLGKDLEEMTASSVQGSIDTNDYIHAKEQWLVQIVRLYERHIMPVLEFLNPDTQYSEYDGLHSVLTKIRDVLQAHQQFTLVSNIQNYTISFLNFYQPIESTATAVNRFIHKERDSIKRFNALEYFYQSKLLPALAETQSDNLNKRLLGSDAVLLPTFSPYIKASTRPQGYAFNESSAYYKNLFNELEVRVKDLDFFADFGEIFANAAHNQQARQKQLRFEELTRLLQSISLRETNDFMHYAHQRLEAEFLAYQLYDLISAVRFFKEQSNKKTSAFTLIQTNRFGIADKESEQYRYRRIRCQLASSFSDKAQKHSPSEAKG